mgnify:CR=1 FL=1
MRKIWAKVLKEHKIVKSYVYEDFKPNDWSEFPSIVMEICGELDIPTPVIIKTHIFNYAKFRTVKFREDDFVESIDFDTLVLENQL